MELTGRIDQTFAGPSSGDHGDMVAGIVMGAGNLDPTTKGMATGAFLYTYDISGYDHIWDAPTTQTTLGVRITSTSYSQGCNEYTGDTRDIDQMIRQNPTLLHVFSAGNNSSDNCGYGAGSGWGTITGGAKQGKNVIATGNLDNQDNLTASSSRGPASDGRVKPDICANGTNQISTDPNNTYAPGGGTSAASPGIAGIVAQLYHAYRDLNGGNDPESALIKACLLNTAHDLGNLGPDFDFGWGRVNARKAYQILEQGTYWGGIATQGNSYVDTIAVPPAVAEMRVMLYWPDYEGSPGASKTLVNDLNLVVTDANSTNHLPLVLDHTPNATNLSAPAVPGVDDRNNMEQVQIASPTPGNHVISVAGFAIPQGPQTYFVVYEFIFDEIIVTYPNGGESLVPSDLEKVRWDAFGSTGNFTIEYSIDSGLNWTVASNSIGGSVRFYNWQPPDVVTGDAFIRVSRGAISGTNQAAFSIIRVPQNLAVPFACPFQMGLSWDPVPGATRYEVFKLGSKYMEAVGSTSDTSFVISGISPTSEEWVSVRATADDDVIGRRAVAVRQQPGVFNCSIADDIALSQVITPVAAYLNNCNDLSSIPVVVEIENTGNNPQTNIQVAFRLNNGAVVTESIAGPINGGSSFIHTFSSTLNFTGQNFHNLKAWTATVPDTLFYNDSMAVATQIVSGSVSAFPTIQNFENMSTCGTSSNCGVTVCNLTQSWINAENGVWDNIDWRVNKDETPSDLTGPLVDHTTGTANGNYIYLEASNSCNFQVAQLVSPCFDLTTTVIPVLNFWYHMYGGNMGRFHLDVFAAGAWHNDVMMPLSGEQGNQWQEMSVNLGAYANEKINIRFRGVTGSGYQSDLALDDIQITEWVLPPTAQFSGDDQQICVNEAVHFTDHSQGAISWQWTFNPSTITYMNGTNATSAHPEVRFDAMGLYAVKLLVSNTFGTDQEYKLSYVEVTDGANLPFTEDFQDFFGLPAFWEIQNPDVSLTWEPALAFGSNGQSTNAFRFPAFSYETIGEEDKLTTPFINLTGTPSPVFEFDLAYAPYSLSLFERLRVEISTDCGATFPTTLYDKQSQNLATASLNTNNWSPAAASHWRTESISLANYVGNTVQLRFVATNGNGNNLYLDNINVETTGQQNPTADFTHLQNNCAGEPVVFYDHSTGANIFSYQWNFGSGGVPGDTIGPGPHSIFYSNPGSKAVLLTIENPAGPSSRARSLIIYPWPNANFAVNLSDSTAQFSNNSTEADSYFWDFGDGNSSTDSSPTHTFSGAGSYIVQLHATNTCTTHVFSQTVEVFHVGVPTVSLSRELMIYPNPSEGLVNVSLPTAVSETLKLELISPDGKTTRLGLPEKIGPQATISLDLSINPRGVYFLKSTTDEGVWLGKVILE